jgi:hypothetical protein
LRIRQERSADDDGSAFFANAIMHCNRRFHRVATLDIFNHEPGTRARNPDAVRHSMVRMERNAGDTSPFRGMKRQE